MSLCIGYLASARAFSEFEPVSGVVDGMFVCDAVPGWAAPLRGKRAITHHKSWVYLERWLGIVEVGNLEAIPGLPPTATHLSQLTREFSDGGADVIIRAPYQDDKPAHWLAERTGITAVVLPLSVGGTEGATDLFSLYDDIINRLLGATK